jgi:pimeloyl-ACP methyl ester carboxylesterase
MLASRKYLALGVLASVLLIACSVREGGKSQADGIAGLVDIGGREIYLECRGEGSPTVILQSGFRNNAMVWSQDPAETGASMVMPALAEVTHVCAYDRPGTIGFAVDALSRSDPIPMPQSPELVTADLHALLEAADVPGPYVLVGHSFGGVFVRDYADTYPDEVVGMVLVDAWPEQLTALLSPEYYERFNELVVEIPPALEGYRDLEFVEPGVVSKQMLASPPQLRPMPLYVIARGQPLGLQPDPQLENLPETVERAWRSGQDALATLTPDARYEIAVESSHYIYVQQPKLVVEAIQKVVEAVREPDSW